MATKMDKSPAFLLYTDKFFTGCADMQPETVGIYIRLLCKLWNSPDGLPNDHKKLARLALVSEKIFTKSWHSDLLSEKFIFNDKNNLTNERLEIVRGERLGKSQLASESARIRWDLERQKNDANAMRTHSERIANAMHIREDKISKENKEKEIDKEKGVSDETPPAPSLKSSEKTKKLFVPPADWKEVAYYMRDYLKEKQLNWAHQAIQQEAEKFYDFYLSKGWKVGNSGMKDWKASVRSWISKAGDFKSQTGGYAALQTAITAPVERPRPKTNDELRRELSEQLKA